MAGGSSSCVKNAAGDWEILNIHHVGRQEGNMIEVLESYNRYNNTTGGPLHIPGPGSPVRSPGSSTRSWRQMLQEGVKAGAVPVDVIKQAGL